MTKTFLSLLAIALIALVVVSGCIFPELEAVNRVKRNPVASDFLAENINARLSTAIWSENESRQRLAELVQKCGAQIAPTDYYYVSFQEADALLEAWVYQRTMAVACVHRSDDQCVNDLGCEDGLLCTMDECRGIPKRCYRTKIRECIGGDGCCPTGCTFVVDFDCAIDECVVHADCSDGNVATKDLCAGLPKKCVHELITECISEDGYCPSGCDYSNDTDCLVSECETDADCDDNDPSSVDECVSEAGKPKVCSYRGKRECVDNDGFCPMHCTYATDNDCLAQLGNYERIIVNCRGYEANLDLHLRDSGEDYLTATFNSVANSINNKGLKFYDNKGYKYNNKETGTGIGEGGIFTKYYTTIIERINIRGKATYFPEEEESTLSFNKNGLEYEVELTNGIPSIASEVRKQDPFVADNDDKITIALFGKDGLVTMVNQNDGEQHVNILSDYFELSVPGNGFVENLLGKNGLKYSMKISRCEKESAVFNLYLYGDFVKGQEAAVGDMLFPEILKKPTRLNYLHKNSISKLCNFRYVTGSYLEKIYHDKEFPFGTGYVSDWKSYLEFENDRLKRIVFRNEKVPGEEPMKNGEYKWVLPFGESEGSGFCSVLFFGVVR